MRSIRSTPTGGGAFPGLGWKGARTTHQTRHRPPHSPFPPKQSPLASSGRSSQTPSPPMSAASSPPTHARQSTPAAHYITITGQWLLQRFLNDPLGQNPTGAPFSADIFDLYGNWGNLHGHSPKSERRQAIARGEELFNTTNINITGVAGLNDALNQQSITGTCTTCHDTPKVGNHSV